MTNEELALRIQSGDAESAGQLWEQVKLLAFKFAGRFLRRSLDRCNRHGVTLDDLQQECFLAVMDAAQAYSPDSGYKFLSFLNFPLKNHFNALIGCRGNQKENPLNNAASLDESLPGAEDPSITMMDALEDESVNFTEETEESDVQRVVREAVHRLKPFHRFLVERNYFQSFTLEQIAQEAGMDREQVRKHKQQALNELRRDKKIRELEPFYVLHPVPKLYSQDPLDVFLWG